MCRYSSNVTHVWRGLRGWRGGQARVCAGWAGPGAGSVGLRAHRPHTSRCEAFARHHRTARPSAQPAHSALTSLPRHTSEPTATPTTLELTRARDRLLTFTLLPFSVKLFCETVLSNTTICGLRRISDMRSRSGGKAIL